MDERIFTLGEANNLVPELEALFAQIKKARQFIYKIRGEIQKVRDHSQANGGSPQGPAYLAALEYIMKHLDQIQLRGVLVKDLEKGLCDFPYMLDGRVVHLCWKMGEPDIRWWHETHTGYANRQPIEKDDES